jgi:hypothetical protein
MGYGDMLPGISVSHPAQPMRDRGSFRPEGGIISPTYRLRINAGARGFRRLATIGADADSFEKVKTLKGILVPGHDAASSPAGSEMADNIVVLISHQLQTPLRREGLRPSLPKRQEEECAVPDLASSLRNRNEFVRLRPGTLSLS